MRQPGTAGGSRPIAKWCVVVVSSAGTGIIDVNFIDLLGWFAALVGATSLLPQLLKLLHTRNTAGVSLFFWQLMLGMNLGWISHGFVIAKPNMIAPNTFMLVCTVTILALLRRERGLPVQAVYPLGLAVGAVLIAGDRLLGPAVFGVLAVIPGLIGSFGQLVDIARSEDISGVSGVFLFWGLSVQILWLSWGTLALDISTVIMSTTMLCCSVLNIGWYLARRAGAHPLASRQRVLA